MTIQKQKRACKRAQQEIIVTVLLVLIALAAVAAIAYFITQNVKTGTEAAASQADCLQVKFEIIQPVNGTNTVSTGMIGTNVTVRRNTGGESINVTGVKILIDGTVTYTIGTNGWGVLDSKTINTSAKTGSIIEIAPVIRSGTCAVADKKTIVSN